MIHFTPKELKRKAEAHQHIRDFENELNMAELKALSKISLERPLTNQEYDDMMILKTKVLQ